MRRSALVCLLALRRLASVEVVSDESLVGEGRRAGAFDPPLRFAATYTFCFWPFLVVTSESVRIHSSSKLKISGVSGPEERTGTDLTGWTGLNFLLLLLVGPDTAVPDIDPPR
jgi:hypothetical protein